MEIAHSYRINGSKKKITREMLDVDKHHKKCPKNCIPMLLDEKTEEKYYVPTELAEVLNIWEEFLQNVKGVKSPFWLHKAGLGIKDDEAYKKDPTIGYFDMPKWKQTLVWKSRTMYNENREFIDEWAEKYKMTERSLIHQKFEWNASRDLCSLFLCLLTSPGASPSAPAPTMVWHALFYCGL